LKAHIKRFAISVSRYKNEKKKKLWKVIFMQRKTC
jgi:hypothetical protein